jgi:hypothetical protein
VVAVAVAAAAAEAEAEAGTAGVLGVGAAGAGVFWVAELVLARKGEVLDFAFCFLISLSMSFFLDGSVRKERASATRCDAASAPAWELISGRKSIARRWCWFLIVASSALGSTPSTAYLLHPEHFC